MQSEDYNRYKRRCDFFLCAQIGCQTVKHQAHSTIRNSLSNLQLFSRRKQDSRSTNSGESNENLKKKISSYFCCIVVNRRCCNSNSRCYWSYIRMPSQLRILYGQSADKLQQLYGNARRNLASLWRMVSVGHIRLLRLWNTTFNR